jgi:hypothetical protein
LTFQEETMAQQTLQSCANGCCRLVDGKQVSEAEYQQAKMRHPGNYVGVAPGQRNAIVEHRIACRSAVKTAV